MINWFGTHAPFAGPVTASESHISWYGDMVGLTFPTEKPPAFLTLDDRALTFDGTWPDITTLQEFKPWNKK